MYIRVCDDRDVMTAGASPLKLGDVSGCPTANSCHAGHDSPSSVDLGSTVNMGRPIETALARRRINL